MRQYFVGIDPGKMGAIAIINLNEISVRPPWDIALYDMPILSNGEIDVLKIKNIFCQPAENSFCILEHAQVMPQQGAVSGFNYGVGYGSVKTVLRMLKISFQEIRPALWKKEYSLPKMDKKDKSKSKKESVVKCLELFPQLKEDQFYTPRGRLLDGRAEAILLADYGRRITGRQ